MKSDALRVVHVVPRIDETSGGHGHSVPGLCTALAERGVAVELDVLASGPRTEGFPFTLHTHRAWPVAARLGVSTTMRSSLRSAARRADIVHNHSLWMMPNVYPVAAARHGRCHLITSPRGTLSSWALRRSRLKKRFMWALCQRQAVQRASLVHATGVGEYGDIRRTGYAGPVAVIPNGMTVAPLHRVRKENARRRLLYLGRLHPIKGLDVLLRAWRRVETAHPNWELSIVGPDECGYRAQLEAQASSLALRRVTLGSAVYGAAKSRLLDDADLFVLPSHSENFGVVVAEALAHGVPVVVSNRAPWGGVQAEHCGWWVDLDDEALAAALDDALGRSNSVLTTMGERGHRWIHREFSWRRVAEMMHTTYEWLIDGGTRPSWVELS